MSTCVRIDVIGTRPSLGTRTPLTLIAHTVPLCCIACRTRAGRFFSWLMKEDKYLDLWNPTAYSIVPPGHMGRDVQQGGDTINCGVFVCFYMVWLALGKVPVWLAMAACMCGVCRDLHHLNPLESACTSVRVCMHA